MEKSVELLRYVKEERLLKCSLVARKLFQGAITRLEKKTYVHQYGYYADKVCRRDLQYIIC